MRYAQIRDLDISNGEGIGVSLFVQGCHFHCYNCFNSETWDFTKGKQWTQDTKRTFMKLINREYITRVSFLGGEPLADENIVEVYDLVQSVRDMYPNKKIWVYTGYEIENFWMYNGRVVTDDFSMEKTLRNELLKDIDVLVDGQFKYDQRDFTLKWCGSTNQRVIDIPKTIIQNKIVLYK